MVRTLPRLLPDIMNATLEDFKKIEIKIGKILKGWKRNDSKVLNYEEGSWGPKEADGLIQKDGRKWL